MAGAVTLALGCVPAPAPARAQDHDAAAVTFLGEPGVAHVAPEEMKERILTALMFEPDGGLAVALFRSFRQAMTVTVDESAAAAHARALAAELLLFLPMDQGRRAAPGLLLALAPEADELRLAAAVELASLIGQDADDLVARAQALEAERNALLPLSAGARLDLPGAGPVDPPPTPAVTPTVLPVTVVVPEEPAETPAPVDEDRQWALVFAQLRAAMPDVGDRAEYLRWYRQWEALTGTEPPGPPPLPGGPTASPH